MTAGRWWSAGGAAAAVAADVALGGALLLWAEACHPSGPRSLTEVLSGYRPFVARLSIDGAHRPCTAQPPFCDPPLRPGDDRFAAIAALAARPASAAEDAPERLHEQGVAALLIGGAAAEEASVLLERAQAAAPDNPRILHDLAVVRWVQADSEDDLRRRLEALELLDEALVLDPGSPAALFDRALVLASLLPLREEALAAWSRVEATGEGAWRQEAVHHRRMLERPTGREEWERLLTRLDMALEAGAWVDPGTVPDRFSQQVRLWLEDRLLPAWGEAVETGDEALATRHLELARGLVSIPVRRGAGRTLSQSLELIENSEDLPARRRDLARAHHAYGDARSAHEKQAYAEAEGPFAMAAVLFEQQRSPFAVWARFYLAVGLAYGEPPDYENALRDLEMLRRDTAGDPVVRGYVEWMIGYVLAYQGELAESLRALWAGADHFESAREEENVAEMHAQSASRLQRMGRRDAAWRHHAAALAQFDSLTKSRRRQNVVSGVAAILQDEGELRLSLYLVDAWVREARRSGNGMSRVLAYSYRGGLRAQLRRTGAALADLRSAIQATADIEDEGTRIQTRIDVAVEEAEVLRLAGDHDAALAVLERADEFIERSRAPLKRVDVLRKKASIERQQGRVRSALGTLSAAEEQIYRMRALLDDARQRSAYLDRLRVVMEDTVVLLVEQGRGAEAFYVAERMRAPELLFALESRPNSGPSHSHELAEDAAVVAFLSLPDRLVVWSIDRDGLTVRRVPLPRWELEARVSAVITELAASQPGRRGPAGAAQELAAQLLPHVLLEGRERILLVPDGPLYALPFAALPDEEGSLLIERHRFILAPSVTVGRLLDRLQRERKGAVASALLVRQPAWDRRVFPELPPLRHRPLAPSIAERFAPLSVIAGPEATQEAFLRLAPRYSLVYFEGHSLAETDGSSRSGLVLAPVGDGDEGLLEPHEIVFAEPPATRLLVLGSCSGASGRVSPTEGALSLVRPFLAAGTPTVVASLGPVEDEAAHALFEELIAAYRPDDDPAELLRRAQLAVWRQRPELASGALLFHAYGSSSEIFVR